MTVNKRIVSRSRKKFAIGSAHESDKIDKKIAHRIFRKRAKQFLKSGRIERLPNSMRDVSDVWSFSKDGKILWSYHTYSYYLKREMTDVPHMDAIIKSCRK